MSDSADSKDQDQIHQIQRKGRAALSNRSGRFEHQVIEQVDDGWGEDHRPETIRTSTFNDTSRSVIAYNESPDIRFDRSINPYRGCEHGCIYCFARPTHAYLGLSPGIDFETRLAVKNDAAKLLAKELQARSYSCDTIALSPNTDCYQPLDRELGLTRQILEVLQRCDHPVSIITKSSLVQRDLDILADMASRKLANVVVSVTTLDATLSAKLEPRASAPHRRIKTIEALSSAGIPVGILFAPLIPYINDAEMEEVLATCSQAGATAAGYVMLRLPLEVRELWTEWLQTHYPDRAQRVMKIVRDSRGGKDYDATFKTRMTGTGQYAELMKKRFKLARKRNGLKQQSDQLDTTLFTPSRLSAQLSLF